MVGSNWIIDVTAVILLQITAYLFYSRVKELKPKLRVTLASKLPRSFMYLTPFGYSYIVIIILVDVGVLHSQPWYTIASACYLTAISLFLYIMWVVVVAVAVVAVVEVVEVVVVVVSSSK